LFLFLFLFFVFIFVFVFVFVCLFVMTSIQEAKEEAEELSSTSTIETPTPGMSGNNSILFQVDESIKAFDRLAHAYEKRLAELQEQNKMLRDELSQQSQKIAELERISLSKRDSADILKMIIGSAEPGMAFKVGDDRSSLVPFRPSGSFVIKAWSSKSFTATSSHFSQGWFKLPVDQCSHPELFSASDHFITIPVSGVWEVKGFVYYDNKQSVGRLCVRVSKNNGPLFERTIYCSRSSGQSYQAIDVSMVVQLAKGDTLTICNYDSLTSGNPYSLLAIDLTATFVADHY